MRSVQAAPFLLAVAGNAIGIIIGGLVAVIDVDTRFRKLREGSELI